MTRKRFDSAPQINVKDEGMLIQQVAGSTTNLLEVKSHSGATLMAVDYVGTMTSGASNTFTYLAATTSASLPANTTIGAVSPTELGYLDGVTSAIQTQLNSKLSTAVTSLTGTANQITVSSSTGAVTLSLPQSIATTSDVTFNNSTVARVIGTNNVHLDPAAGYDTYLNYYQQGRPIYAYGSLRMQRDSTGYYQVSTGTWSGDAPNGQGKLEYHSNRWYFNTGGDSNAESWVFRRGASNVVTISSAGSLSATNLTSTSRMYAGEWLQFNANAGCYWPNTGFDTAPHLYPSQSTYATLRVVGRRNGYAGIEFSDAAGPCVIMYDTGGNGGLYDYQDWQLYWNRGNRSLSIGGSSQPVGSYYKCYVNGRLYVSDFMYNVGRYYGAQSNSGATIQMSSGNATHFQWGSYYAFFVDSTHVKTFVIDHPTKENNYLVHACAEGPTSDVFYRGEGQLQNGICVVTLPDYFEDLTEKHGRTVMITPIADENGPAANLSAYEIENGQFVVEQIGGYHVPFQRFWWRVDAIRKNTSFDVEPSKTTHEVAGDGPYTYLRRKV